MAAPDDVLFLSWWLALQHGVSGTERVMLSALTKQRSTGGGLGHLATRLSARMNAERRRIQPWPLPESAREFVCWDFEATATDLDYMSLEPLRPSWPGEFLAMLWGSVLKKEKGAEQRFDALWQVLCASFDASVGGLFGLVFGLAAGIPVGLQLARL